MEKKGRASIAALDLPIQLKEEEAKEELLAHNVLILERTHSLDSGLDKIVSVPTIEEIKSEQIIVPARDVLLKMPFYSTPLSFEATNNAFRDFMVRLNEMGFVEEAEAALVATHAESVESAVEFIMNNKEALFHRFAGSGTDTHTQCEMCTLDRQLHIIDSKGDKIETETDLEELDLEQIISQKVQSILCETKKEEMEIIETKKEEIIETANMNGVKCLICFEDRNLDMFYDALCGHNYCKVCLSEHYRIKTVDGDVLKLACIEPACDRLIGEEEILLFLIDAELREKFVKFRKTKLLMLNQNARFCCKPDCTGSMVGSRLNRKLVCPVCSTAVCFNCSQPWHGLFVGCNQNIDIGYKKWALNKDVHKCPKCRMAIEKDDGCNHMTCGSCKYEFCWICKGPYNEHHFEWWNIFGCPGAQYTPRFCRCAYCFPRWLNRILIILCFLSVVVPLVVIAAAVWFIIICLIFCVRCDFKCDIDPCDCF